MICWKIILTLIYFQWTSQGSCQELSSKSLADGETVLVLIGTKGQRSDDGDIEERRRSRNDNFLRFGRSGNEKVLSPEEIYSSLQESSADGADDYQRYRKIPRKTDNFIRFGRAKGGDFIRFGRSDINNLIPNKKSKNPKQTNFLRFGKRDMYEDEDAVSNSSEETKRFRRSTINEEYAAEQNEKQANMNRNERNSDRNMIRFGRNNNFMRFGRSHYIPLDIDGEVNKLSRANNVDDKSDMCPICSFGNAFATNPFLARLQHYSMLPQIVDQDEHKNMKRLNAIRFG